MEKKMSDDVILKGPIVVIIPLVLFLSFILFWVWDSHRLSHKFKECSFYTIATPTEMTNSHSLYFTFSYKGKIYDSYTTVGAEDLGLWYTQKSAMSRRYWVKVSCADLRFDEMQWEIKVPDTLQYIPFNGWKEIPYGLKEE
jgi:hypothetical protein